jgi:hypothetical protein
LEGLRRTQEAAVNVSMTSATLSERDESRGVYNLSSDILELQQHIEGFHDAIKPDEELK